MTEVTGNFELAVALGRIEEMLKSMNDKLDKLESVNEDHADVLRKHEVAIRLLEQRQPQKVHPLTIITGVASIIAVALVVIDRYVN